MGSWSGNSLQARVCFGPKFPQPRVSDRKLELHPFFQSTYEYAMNSLYDGIVVRDLSIGEREISEVVWHVYPTRPCAFTRDSDDRTIVYSVWLWYFLLRPIVQLGYCLHLCDNMTLFPTSSKSTTGVLSTSVDMSWILFGWYDFISDLAQEYNWGIVYVCRYVPGLFAGIYDDMTRVYYFCYFIYFVFFMMSRDSRPLRSVKLTDKGLELIERKVRGRCASAFKVAQCDCK